MMSCIGVSWTQKVNLVRAVVSYFAMRDSCYFQNISEFLDALWMPCSKKLKSNSFYTAHNSNFWFFTLLDAPQQCPVRILTAESYYRFRCAEKALQSADLMRQNKAAMLRCLLPALPSHIHFLVFTRLLSHNKRLEEYPATRMAFGKFCVWRFSSFCNKKSQFLSSYR